MSEDLIYRLQIWGVGAAIVAVGMSLVGKAMAANDGKWSLVVVIAGLAALVGLAPYAPFLLAVVLLALVSLYLAKRDKEATLARRQALADLAADLGLDFSVEDPEQLGPRCAPFRRGGKHSATNVIYGERQGRRLAAFDLSYAVGDNSHQLSVVVATVRGSLGDLLVRPEVQADRLKAAVGAEDIDFESHEFSSRFYVRSRDRKLAYDVITPQMMEYLLARRDWTIEARGCDVMLSNERNFEPEEFREAIAVLEGFIDRVPKFVWQGLREEREAERSAELRGNGP